jgi:hypothetical protein
MSWRDARAKVDSGFYKQKEKSGFETGFAGAADIIASSWMRDAAEEKEEKKRVDAENRAERKRIRASQEKADAVAKKNKKNALILAETFTGATAPETVQHFSKQLSLMDGDVGSVMTSTQNMVDSGRIEFTPPGIERGEAQGPNIPADPKLVDLGMSVNKDGTTTLPFDPYDDEGKLTGEARPVPDRAFKYGGEDVRRSDLPALKKVGWTEAAQMEQVFSDRGTPIEGTTGTGPKTVPIEAGVKITPYGKTPAKIDFDRIKTLEDIELYKLEMNANGMELSPELQSIVDNRELVLKGKNLKTKISTLAGDLDAARNQLQAAEVLQETDTDEYIAIKALVVSQENNLKPWETILEPNSFVGMDKDQLEQKRRVAKSLGAPDTKLTVLDAEIEALGKIVTDIKWSDITESNFEGMAKEYEDKGREADAALIIEFGKAKQNPPMDITQLDNSSDDLLAILSRETTDPQYKSRIDAVIDQKKLTADSTPIEFSKITKENFEGTALELDANRPEDAKRVRDYGRILNADTPLTLTELVKSDDIVLMALQNSQTNPEYKNTINKAIRLKAAFKKAESIEEFNILAYDNAETSTIQAIINSNDTAPQNIVKLQVLLNSRNAQAPKIMAGSETFLVMHMDNGVMKTATTKLTQDGRYVDLSNPTKVVTPAPDTDIINLDLQGGLYDDVVKIQQSIIVPLDTQREAMASTLESAKKLDDLVNPAMGGDPAILTVVGGKITPFFTNLGIEAATLVDMLNNNGATVSDVSTFVDGAVSKYMARTGAMNETTKKASLFQAEKIKLAFAFAASSLGQSNTGLSNKDFENSLKIIDSGQTYATFSSNLKSQANAVVNKTTRDITKFKTSPLIKIIKQTNNSLFSGYDQTAEQYAVSSNLGDAFAWANGSASPPISSPPTSSVPTLQEFLVAAREVNPDFSDAEITVEYNRRYGGSN